MKRYTDSMKVAVGTKNPAKLRAIHAALVTVFKQQHVEIIGIEVSSGVADQPMNDSESMQGAFTRANNALREVKGADLGIGLEGGLQQIDDVWFAGNIACAITKQLQVGYGISQKVSVPKEIIIEIEKGKDLSEATHAITGIADIGKKQGLLGYVTDNLITRESASEQAIIAAITSVLKKF